MREYDLPIIGTNHGPAASALLKVIRLPTFWYAVIRESPERYASFTQDRTEKNGGHDHLNHCEFVDRIRLVSSFTQGIDFEYGAAL